MEFSRSVLENFRLVWDLRGAGEKVALLFYFGKLTELKPAKSYKENIY